MLSECKYQTTDDKKKSIKSNESTKLINELIKAELIQIDKFELIDDFVIDKTLNQIKLKQQCGMEDCDLQLGKILFADYIIFCYSSIENSSIVSGYHFRGKGLPLEQEILKVKLNLYDMRNGKYLHPETFGFSSRDFYLKKYKDGGLAGAFIEEPFFESKFPQQSVISQYIANFSEPIQFNKDSEDNQIKEVGLSQYEGKSRVLLIGKNGGYEKDWNDINHKLLKDLSKEYEIIDEEAKKKALKQLAAQQKCGIEDCGINLSKLLNADYTVDLSIINDLEFIFEVKSKDNRRIQYYKSQISDYGNYRFSFRDCIRNADCLQTAAPIPESETTKGVLNRPTVLLSCRPGICRVLRKYLSDEYKVIEEVKKNDALNQMQKQKKCDLDATCQEKIIKFFNPDYYIEVKGELSEIVIINKEGKQLFSHEFGPFVYPVYQLYRVKECLKNGNCEKLKNEDL